jgi:phage baseplate assembly protein W
MAAELVPKLKLPLRMDSHGFATVDQDSDRDVQQCAYAVLATELGSRVELPDFGITDQALRKHGADRQELDAALARWEPRARGRVELEITNFTGPEQATPISEHGAPVMTPEDIIFV